MSADPMEVTIRPALAGDVEPIRLLVRAAYERYTVRIGREAAPMTADYAAAVERGHTWIAESGGRIVGLLVLEPAVDHLLVDVIAVAPQSQGQGIGSRLLQLAEDRARALGLAEIRLYTNEAMTENLVYYPRRGYRETHRAAQHGYRRVFFTKQVLKK